MPKKQLTEATKPVAEPKVPAPQTKRYDEVFKRQAVEHWIQSGQPGTQIAAELGLSYPSLKEWKRRYCGDATPLRSDLEAENRALKAELARVHASLGQRPRLLVQESQRAEGPIHPGRAGTYWPGLQPSSAEDMLTGPLAQVWYGAHLWCC